LAGVTAVPRRVANVPRVAESLAAMECKVIDIVQFRNTAGEKVEGWLVLGEVVAVYIDKLLLKACWPRQKPCWHRTRRGPARGARNWRKRE